MITKFLREQNTVLGKAYSLMRKTNLEAKYYRTVWKECTVHLRSSLLGFENHEGDFLREVIVQQNLEKQLLLKR